MCVVIKALAEHWYVFCIHTKLYGCTCQNRGMHTHYGNPYLSVSTTAFLRKYRGKGVILVVGNRTPWSERLFTVQNPQLPSDQKPKAAQD